MSFDVKITFLLILLQYILIILFIYTNYVFIINMILELFTILLFIILLLSKFGYKILIL